MTKRLYAGDSPLLASGLRSLALLLRARGDPAQAEALLRESLEMRSRIQPGDSAGVAADLQSLGILLQARGDLAAAEPCFRNSLEMNRRLLPGDHANKSACLNNLAHVLLARGDPAGAEPLAREAVAMFERMVGKDTYATGNAREKFGRALAGLGRWAEAETELLEPSACSRRPRACRRDGTSSASGTSPSSTLHGRSRAGKGSRREAPRTGRRGSTRRRSCTRAHGPFTLARSRRTAPPADALELRSVSRRFGTTAGSRSAQLHVRDGDCYGFIGHNGAVQDHRHAPSRSELQRPDEGSGRRRRF
jgi:hypothetical protein